MPTLSEIFRTKLVPWSKKNVSERFIIGSDKMCATDMPYGVNLVSYPIRSPRVRVQHRRGYGSVRNVIAKWPAAGLQELGKSMLICVLDGYIDYPLGNYRVQCGAGHFIFIPPGTPCPDGTRTYIHDERGSSCDIITFLLHPNALECWTSHAHEQGRDVDNNYLVQHDRVFHVFQALMGEVIEGGKHSVEAEEGLLRAFFSILQREIEEGRCLPVRLPVQARKIKSGDSSEGFADYLDQYVQSNFHKPLTLETVAADMYLSPAQFTRNVRRETGKSFGEILAAHRMEEAKILLCESRWSIANVAIAVGFRSTSYFRTFFKRYTGITPRKFREKYQNAKNDKK